MPLSVVAVGILNKVNRVGSCVVILFDLEVGSGEAERTQNHVAQILKFTCIGRKRKRKKRSIKHITFVSVCLYL